MIEYQLTTRIDFLTPSLWLLKSASRLMSLVEMTFDLSRRFRSPMCMSFMWFSSSTCFTSMLLNLFSLLLASSRIWLCSAWIPTGSRPWFRLSNIDFPSNSGQLPSFLLWCFYIGKSFFLCIAIILVESSVEILASSQVMVQFCFTRLLSEELILMLGALDDLA